MDEIEVYKELGTYERHFNQMQSVCRSLASTWLLATFAGIGYIFEKFTTYGSTGVRLAAALVALAGGTGISLLWIIDVVVYHRLLVAVTEQSKKLETEHKNVLPQLREAFEKAANSHFLGKERGARNKMSLFYGFPATFLSIVAFACLVAIAVSGNTSSIKVVAVVVFAAWLLPLALFIIGVIFKENRPAQLSAGVLIIGSLMWDTGRQAWRDARLDMTSAQTVTAPIRYGRLSGSRGNTYTMVFSRQCKAGHAKVLRCTRSVSTPADLIAEAEALWKAEQPSADPGRIATDWGCVALLCNPDRKIPEDLLKAWAERVEREPNYGRVSQTQGEGRLIDKDGLLQIDWPRLVETRIPVQVDLLLVTANDPRISATSPNYPSVETIAGAWNAASSRHAEYFWRNVEIGIHTFQDDEIRALLHH